MDLGVKSEENIECATYWEQPKHSSTFRAQFNFFVNPNAGFELCKCCLMY